MARRALVTGATGGVGLGLTEALIAAGYEVVASGRRADVAPRLEAMGAQVRLGDLSGGDLAALCDGAHVVLHAAALSSPWGDEATFIQANVLTTRALLAAARRAGCEAFIFVSSPSIYAQMRDRLNLTEADPPAVHPMNGYARTKLAAEREVLAAAGPGFHTVALRPRAVVGPDDQVLLPRLLRILRRGRFPLFRGGRALIELTDVRDVADALVAADRNRAALSGRAVNVSGGRPRSVIDLVGDLAEAMGRKVRFVHPPASLAFAAATGLEAICRVLPGRPEPPVTRFSLAALTWSQTFDLTFARQALGYAPRFDANRTAMEMARALAS